MVTTMKTHINYTNVPKTRAILKEDVSIVNIGTDVPCDKTLPFLKILNDSVIGLTRNRTVYGYFEFTKKSVNITFSADPKEPKPFDITYVHNY